MRLFKKRKIALVLGGGSARGLVSIGALRVLERHFGRDNMPFDMIVGTSIGSLIGAAYSLGIPVDEIERRATAFHWKNIVDFGVFATGLVKGDKLEELIKESIENKGFKDVKIPFALTTTNLHTGKENIHTSGNLIKLIRASCSWPGIFTAVDVDGEMLVDGGVRNSIPTKDAYKLGATLAVAVDPGFAIKNQPLTNVIEAFIQGVQIMGEELNLYQGRVADAVIKSNLEDIDQFGFEKSGEIIARGEIAAEAAMARIKRKLFFHRFKCPCK